MQTRKQLHMVLLRCKGGPHVKTNKALRKKNKQELKNLLTLNKDLQIMSTQLSSNRSLYNLEVCYTPLDKRLKSLPFHGSIHGFESRTVYHIKVFYDILNVRGMMELITQITLAGYMVTYAHKRRQRSDYLDNRDNVWVEVEYFNMVMLGSRGIGE